MATTAQEKAQAGRVAACPQVYLQGWYRQGHLPYHATKWLLKRAAVGQQLYKYSSSLMLTKLRLALKNAEVSGAEQATLKLFRCSKATAMVKAGCKRTEVLLAGELKTQAFARYVDVEIMDGQMVQTSDRAMVSFFSAVTLRFGEPFQLILFLPPCLSKLNTNLN